MNIVTTNVISMFGSKDAFTIQTRFASFFNGDDTDSTVSNFCDSLYTTVGLPMKSTFAQHQPQGHPIEALIVFRVRNPYCMEFRKMCDNPKQGLEAFKAQQDRE